MKLLIIGDLHGEYELLSRMLARLQNVGHQVLLLTGDLSVDALPADGPAAKYRQAAYDASLLAVDRVLDLLEVPLLYVPGNHDLPTLALKGTHTRNIDLLSAGKSEVVEDVPFWGIGGSTTTPGSFPYEYSEDELVASFPECDLSAQAVVLTHCPPADSELETAYGNHTAGCTTLRRRIPPLSPKLWVCGHVHEGGGVDIVDGVPVLNAGGFVLPTAAVFDGNPQNTAMVLAMHAWIVETAREWTEILITRVTFSLDPSVRFRPSVWRLQQTSEGTWRTSQDAHPTPVTEQMVGGRMWTWRTGSFQQQTDLLVDEHAQG